MQLHQLSRKTARKRKKIVGRGGKRGTTSGKGTKGQRARAGHRIRPEIRDAIKRLPKLRGSSLNSRFIPQSLNIQVVSLETLTKNFAPGETVSPKILATKSLVKNARRPTKILGKGEVIKLTIEGCKLSLPAREAIIKAGGTIK